MLSKYGDQPHGCKWSHTNNHLRLLVLLRNSEKTPNYWNMRELRNVRQLLNDMEHLANAENTALQPSVDRDECFPLTTLSWKSWVNELLQRWVRCCICCCSELCPCQQPRGWSYVTQTALILYIFGLLVSCTDNLPVPSRSEGTADVQRKATWPFLASEH